MARNSYIYEIWSESQSCQGETIYIYVTTIMDYSQAAEICKQNSNYRLKILGRGDKDE